MNRNITTLLTALVLITLALSACASRASTQAPAANTDTVATEAVVTEAIATEVSMTEAVATEAVETQATGEGVMLPEVDPAAVSGSIVAAGSSTVFPLAEALRDRFEEEGFTGEITIDSIGTGAGFERFCKNGESDISNASRAIKDSEIESCRAIGREPIEFRVGTDALAVVVSQENDFLTDLSMEDLAKVFSSDAQKWSDINPEWPAEDIIRYIPGTESGTFDFFVEFAMRPVYGTDNDADKVAALEAANLNQSEDDNVLVAGVEGSPYSIGYFGYAYYQENADQLRAITINGIEPSFESAESGEYPLARPLFIYSDASIMAEKPQVAAFINFFLTFVNEEVEDAGYFPASPEALDEAKQNYLDAIH